MQALPRSMGVPAQAMPVRPSQRDAAAADAQGKASVPQKKSTLRQTYNFLADPEKHPKLAKTPSSGDNAPPEFCVYRCPGNACDSHCARVHARPP